MFIRIFDLSSDDGEKVTPVPIPNTMVKLLSADGTAWVTKWQSRTLLDLMYIFYVIKQNRVH
jgi:hypothetical protein